MQISEMLNKNLIDLNLKGKNKEEVLNKMVGILKTENKIKSKDKFFSKIIAREKEGSTGFGREIAVPHGKSETVNELSLAVGRVKAGIQYNSMDGRKVKLLFMVADYQGYSPDYLKLVSTLASWLRDDNFRKNLIKAENEEEFIDLFIEKERSTD